LLDGRNLIGFSPGQTPVLKYDSQLMQAILHNRLRIARVVNTTVIPVAEAAKRLQ
jgi:glutathione-independent formaldehyde dehydrogenase